MPQMKPMFWFLLMVYFLVPYLLIIIMMYFFELSKSKINHLYTIELLKFNKFKFKW